MGRPADRLASSSKAQRQASGAKMPVVRERVSQLEPAHYDEGNVIDNSGAIRVAAPIRFPRRAHIVRAGMNEAA